MEDLWRQSPSPALRVWWAGARCEGNEALALWARQTGIPESTWLGQGAAQAPQGPVGVLHWQVAGQPVRATRVNLPDGCVVWLQGDAVSLDHHVSPARLLDMVQSAGRVGLAIRDIDGDQATWDEHLCRMMDWPTDQPAPSFEQALARLHPDDVPAFREVHALRQNKPGRYSLRFRVRHADGHLRHLNSVYEILPRTETLGPVLVSLLVDDTEAIESEQRLGVARERLAETVSLSGVRVWQCDTQGRPVDELSGGRIRRHAAPWHVGLREGEEAHPDDLLRLQAALSQPPEGNQRVERVCRRRSAHAGGHEDWRQGLVRAVPRRDEAGAWIGWSGVSLDLTALDRERERSLSRLDRMQLAADAVGVGFWTRDLDRGVVEWDRRMFHLHHRRPEEGPPTLDEWLHRHVHDLDRTLMAQRQAQQYSDWTPESEVRFRIPTPDGGVRWIQSWTRRVMREGRRVAFGVHVDVTDQREAELAREQERERDRFAIDAAGMGLWERGLGSRPSRWSETMYRLRGLSPDDPRSLEELVAASVSERDRAEADQLMQACLDNGQAYRHEFRVTWPDGSERWLLSLGRPVRDADGRALALAGVNMDVTERRLAEALSRERDRAAQAHAAQSELMARVSHELRTPLNAVLGFADLLANDATGRLDPLQHDWLAHIRTAGTQLLLLIDDLLDLARAEGAPATAPLQSVAVADAAAQAGTWLARQAQDAHVALQFDGPLEGHVWAAPRQFTQVLTNLMSNAIKYNRAGGRVWVESWADRLADGRPAWRVSIHDTGRGLTDEQRSRLFEPFNRLGVERDGIAGTGIGLSIVRRLVTDMGGEVHVQSQPGVGSVFAVRLPMAPELRPEPEQEPEQGPSVAGREAAPAPPAAPQAPDPAVDEAAPARALLHVLYVEDNPVNAMLLDEMLRLRGDVRLSLAEDAATGLAMALDLRPDVLLLDMQLPDGSGSDLMRRMRAQPALQGCRYIALSANAMPADVAAARAAGFDDYWTKPLSWTTLSAHLDHLVGAMGPA